MDNYRHNNVSDMLRDLEADTHIQREYRKKSEETRLTRLLYVLRCKAGMTQKEFAEKAGCAQSVISRIENAKDRDLKLDDLIRYAETLEHDLSIGFRTQQTTLADRFHYHLDALTKCSEEIRNLANDDLKMLVGAADIFSDAAKSFCQELEKVKTQLIESAGGCDEQSPEYKHDPLIVETSEIESPNVSSEKST